MKKINFLLLTFPLVYADGLYKREFKTIDMSAKNITDTYIIKNIDMNKVVNHIDKLIKNKKYLKAKMLIKLNLPKTKDSFVIGKLLNYEAIVIKNTENIKNAIKFLENSIQKGYIKEDNISNTYLNLLKFNVEFNNYNKINIYYNIINKIYKNYPDILNKADIYYSKNLISRGQYTSARKILENIFYTTKNEENAATAAILLIKLIFKENKDFKNIEKILKSVYKYKKSFFLDNQIILLENMEIFYKIDKPIIYNILSYIFHNINKTKYNAQWKQMGEILSQKYFKNKNYKKAKEVLLEMSSEYKILYKKDLKQINIQLDIIYGIMEIKPIEVLIKKYNNTEYINYFYIIKNYLDIKHNNIYDIAKNYKRNYNIDKKYFEKLYFNKNKIIKNIENKLFEYFIINNNKIKDKDIRNILLQISSKKIKKYYNNFPINHFILKLFNEEKYYKDNQKLYNLFLDNYNVIINRDLIDLFIRTNLNHTLIYINKILNTEDIPIQDKKYFFIAKINIAILNEDVKTIKKSFRLFNKFQLNNLEIKNIYYNYYLLIKQYSVEEEELENILISIINLSTNDIKYRPFVDFELVLLENEKKEYEKSIVILNNIPRKIFLTEEKKAKLYYFYAITYNELNNIKERDKYINKCLFIRENNIWTQNCNFIKNRLK